MHLRDRAHRWAALTIASVVLGATPVVALGASSSPPAGAATVSHFLGTLTVSPTSLSFGEATLGTFVGPVKFTMTNGSASVDTVSFVPTGPAANDYHGVLESNCPQLGANDSVALPGNSQCTVDTYFNPGALGTRNSVVNLSDTFNSGASVSLTGIGGIGYYQVDNMGTVAYAGDAGFFGDASKTALNKPIVAITPTGDDGGYWLVATDGGIFNYGDAGFFGSAGALPLNKPIVGMAATSDAGGYWMVASDGGIFDYGDAQFYGSAGSLRLNKPVVGMAATADGGGYWLVASDGGIFTYGDALFYGSAGSIHLNKPIVGMAATPDGGGYWLVASDGGIFTYGDAQFYGSTGAIQLNQPIVAMAPMPDGGGYWFTAADGGLFNYGTAPFLGAGTGLGLGPVVDMAADGGPTAQAASDQPALRHDVTQPRWLQSGAPATGHKFAGP